jgi:hypothetical protein
MSSVVRWIRKTQAPRKRPRKQFEQDFRDTRPAQVLERFLRGTRLVLALIARDGNTFPPPS